MPSSEGPGDPGRASEMRPGRQFSRIAGRNVLQPLKEASKSFVLSRREPISLLSFRRGGFHRPPQAFHLTQVRGRDWPFKRRSPWKLRGRSPCVTQVSNTQYLVVVLTACPASCSVSRRSPEGGTGRRASLPVPNATDGAGKKAGSRERLSKLFSPDFRSEMPIPDAATGRKRTTVAGWAARAQRAPEIERTGRREASSLGGDRAR